MRLPDAVPEASQKCEIRGALHGCNHVCVGKAVMAGSPRVPKRETFSQTPESLPNSNRYKKAVA